MGDNIWLGDRDGVRTPMQWTPDRNAGFSTADPGRLHLPVIMDPVFGYQGVNVEAQLDNTSSLLHWTRRMIHVRKATRPSASATSSTSAAATRRAPYVRESSATTRAVRQQPVPLPPAGRARPAPLGGRRPVELLGGTRFPQIGELPYLLTLAGHGFYWFRLRPRAASDETVRRSTGQLDRLVQAALVRRQGPRLRGEHDVATTRTLRQRPADRSLAHGGTSDGGDSGRTRSRCATTTSRRSSSTTP